MRRSRGLQRELRNGHNSAARSPRRAVQPYIFSAGVESPYGLDSTTAFRRLPVAPVRQAVSHRGGDLPEGGGSGSCVCPARWTGWVSSGTGWFGHELSFPLGHTPLSVIRGDPMTCSLG